MTNKRLFTLLYLLLLLFIFWIEFKPSKITVGKISNRDYNIERNSNLDKIFKEYQKPLELDKIDMQWGIFIKKTKPKKKRVLQDNNKNHLLKVVVKNKLICIKKECFKLLGIFSHQDINYATFYNKNKKKLKTFMSGKFLSSSIKIDTIVKTKVIFRDINSSRVWQIKQFDVNSSKYKPKEFE